MSIVCLVFFHYATNNSFESVTLQNKVQCCNLWSGEPQMGLLASVVAEGADFLQCLVDLVLFFCIFKVGEPIQYFCVT